MPGSRRQGRHRDWLLDNGSAAAIEKLFTSTGGYAIHYDRQVTGSAPPSTSRSTARPSARRRPAGVVAAMKANNTYKGGTGRRALGRPDRPERVLVQAGNHAVFNPLFKSGKLKKGPQQFVPDRDANNAATIFDADARQDEQQHPGRARGERQHRRRRRSPTEGEAPQARSRSAGQDATAQGNQNIISGWQSGTVYKHVLSRRMRPLLAAAALIKGKKPKTNGLRREREASRSRPMALPGPVDHEGELESSCSRRASSSGARSASGRTSSICK